jgi:hypothetical protein
MKPFLVTFSFETPFNRGHATILWEAEDAGKARLEAQEHIDDVKVFTGLFPMIEYVHEATPEEVEEFHNNAITSS